MRVCACNARFFIQLLKKVNYRLSVEALTLCAGDIKLKAIKCKHCGEWLNKDAYS